MRSLRLFLLSLLALPAAAQVSFSTIASNTDIAKNEYVQIEYVVENAKQIDELKPPSFAGFNIVQGPNQSTGMSIVNGAMTQYKAVTYLLQPLRTGKMSIGGASANVDGKSMKSNAVQINVRNAVAGATSPANNAPSPSPDPGWPADERAVDRQYVLRPGDNVSDIIKKNFFIKVDVSKSSCYVGEPIVATYKLCSRLQSESQVVKQPSLNGFSVFDMTEPGTDQSGVEKINGRPFMVHIIRKVQLVPLVEGAVVLDPVQIDNTLHFVKGRQKQNAPGQGLRGLIDQLLDESSDGVPFDQQLSLESKPITINVKPLPAENKPSDFSGAVGQFSISASVPNRAIDTADASTLDVTIRGTGNLPVINAPLPQWPDGTESYATKTREDINKTQSPLGGRKTFSYSFIPSLTGTFIIPPVQLSYFDPAVSQYKTVRSDPVHYTVVAGKKKRPLIAASAPVVVKTDERPVFDYVSAHWMALATGLLLAFALVYIVMQNKTIARNKKIKADALLEAKRKEEVANAAPAIVDPLLESKMLLSQGEFSQFYRSINRSIWQAVADKLALPSSQLNKTTISYGLREDGWSEPEIARLRNVLNECEMKLYTPDHNAYDMQRVLSEAEEITGRLQHA